MDVREEPNRQTEFLDLTGDPLSNLVSCCVVSNLREQIQESARMLDMSLNERDEILRRIEVDLYE